MSLSAFLGLARESSVAFMFGSTGTTDAFLIAMIIPNFVSAFLTSSVTSVFITVYGGYLSRGDEEQAQYTANVILSFFIMLLFGLSVFAIIETPWIVHFIAPKYSGNQLTLTIALTRLLMPNLFFGGLVGVLVGINNSHHSFIAPSINGLTANIIALISIYTLGRTMGIYGLAIGSVLGISFQFFIQFVDARRFGFRFKFIPNIHDSGFREIMVMVVPFILSASVAQVNLVIDRTLATGLEQGAVSSLYFADKIVYLPTVFTGAIATVTFPLFVTYWAQKHWDELAESINRSLRLTILLILPAVLGLYTLRIPFVRLFFLHGEFTNESALITANVVAYLLGALFFGSIVSVLVKIFIAAKNVIFPVVAGAISVGINIALSLWLIHPMQQNGLALANSLAALANLLLLVTGLFFVLKIQRLTKFKYKEFSIFFVKVFIAGLVMSFCVNSFYHLQVLHFSGRLTSEIITLGSTIFGIIVYFFMIIFFRIEESQKAIRFLLEWLKKIRSHKLR